MTIQSLPPSEPPPRTNLPRPNLLVQGFRLGLRNWPCVVWTYAINLLFGLLAGVPFSSGLASYLDHSLSAKKIAGTMDFSYLGELAMQVRDTGFFPMAAQTAQWLNLLQVLVLFVLFTGSVFVYVSAEPPRFSVLLRGGIAYFWRFVRAAIVAGFMGAVIVGFLFGLRSLLLARARTVHVERELLIYSAISAVLILLVGLLVRLWWDLVEVYIVRNAMDGERSIRPALLPALHLLFRHFFRIFGSFLFAGVAGVFAFAFCLLLWRLIPAHQVWIACLLAQLGLFLLLAGRFWQRGVEATLVMSEDPPRMVTEEMEPEESFAVVEERVPATPTASYLAGLSEPTLRDLVLKLRTEPLANPEVLSGPLPSLPQPDPVQAPQPAVKPAEGNEPSLSLLDRHETKFPLGGLEADKKASPVEPLEQSKVPDILDKTPHSEKKPLP